jgi:hypothetical protein
LAESIPSVAASLNNVVKVFKDFIGKEIIFKVFPNCFVRIEFRTIRGEMNKGDIVGHF